jgi:hypothetical protein
MSKVVAITEKVPQNTSLPNGWYKGVQGGYVVDVMYNGKDYQIKTDDGVRGFNISVVINIEGDNIEIHSLKN